MKYRQNLIIYSFTAVCFLLCLISNSAHFKQFGSEHNPINKSITGDQIEESFFKQVNYYSLVKERPFLELNSSELSLSDHNDLVIGFDPAGTLYRYEKDGKILEPIIFTAKNSRAFLGKKELHLDKNVEVKVGSTSLKSHQLSVIDDGEILRANDDVQTLSSSEKTGDQILITSSKANYRPKDQYFEFLDSVSGSIKRKRIYESSVNFKTNRLTLDGRENTVSMQGNISFKKDNLDAQANRGEVFLENYNKRLKYYALYDDVRLQESLINNGIPLTRKAIAEKLEGITGERKIILTGYPKVFQGRDVIKGNRIIIRENIETVEVDDANSSITLDKKDD